MSYYRNALVCSFSLWSSYIDFRRVEFWAKRYGIMCNAIGKKIRENHWELDENTLETC